MHKKALTALLLTMFAVPLAHGATSIDAEPTLMIVPGSSANLSFNVTIDCLDFIPDGIVAGGSLDVTVSASGVDWISADDKTVSFSGADCLLALADLSVPPTLTKTDTITLSADAAAPGMTGEALTLNTGDGTDTTEVMADYVPGYLFSTAQTFPLELHGEPVTFEAMVHITANARTMAMWLVDADSEFVSISGIPEFITFGDDVLAGDLEVMQPVQITVSPPEAGSWDEDSITFHTWSHFLDAGDMKTSDQSVTWRFVNAGGGSDAEGSPGVGTLALVGLLAVAAFAARRRA